VVEPTHLKNMLLKLETFPKVRDENKKYFKPPPRKYGPYFWKMYKFPIENEHVYHCLQVII